MSEEVTLPIQKEICNNLNNNRFAIIRHDKNKPKIGDFVVVKFNTKKQFKHYSAIILSFQDENFYEVKYLRKKSKNLFVFPNIDDIAIAFEDDIETILKKPKVIRDIHQFGENLSAFNF